MMSKIDSIKELYVSQLQDMLDAEEQLVDALHKMAEKAGSDKLKASLHDHLETTKQQAETVKQILESMGEEVKGKKCKGMQGIISEGEEMLRKDVDRDVMDVAIVDSASKVEHYEMASYNAIKQFADLLGDKDAADKIGDILREEEKTAKSLEEMAKKEINVEAPLR